MIIKVKLTPSAKEDKVLGQDDQGVWKVRVKAPADKGKANQALIDVLSTHFGVPKRSIIIKSGFTERSKVVLIEED